MTSKYLRSEIYNFFELPENEQVKKIKEMDFLTHDELGHESFVLDPCDDGNYLPLSNFMRTDKSRFTHGVYGLSYFSAYFITISRCGTVATVAYKHF
jgi:hypothetical protein